MSQQEIQMDEISVKELITKGKKILHFLVIKWKTILLAAVIGGLIGFGYAFWKKPEYKALISFALEDDKQMSGGLTGALGLASSLGIDLGTSAGGAFSGANLIELMKSRRMVEKTFLETVIINGQKKVLANIYLKTSGIHKKLTNYSEKFKDFSYPSNTNQEDFSLIQDSVLLLLYEDIIKENILSVAQKDKKISIITVEVNSQDEQFSKLFAENLVQNVSDFYIETKSKKARNNVSILQRQTDSIRNELNLAITGVASSTDNTFNLNPALNINRVPSTKKQIDVQANTAILTQLVTNLEMAKVTLLKETPLIQLIDKPILPLKKEKVSTVKSITFGGLLGIILSVLWLLIYRSWKKMF